MGTTEEQELVIKSIVRNKAKEILISHIVDMRVDMIGFKAWNFSTTVDGDIVIKLHYDGIVVDNEKIGGGEFQVIIGLSTAGSLISTTRMDGQDKNEALVAHYIDYNINTLYKYKI